MTDTVEIADWERLPASPMVSVCMITYNHERFIAQAIESVLMQETDFPVELVIGEDCSTDGTRAIVLDYGKRYPDRIRLLLPKHNLGMNPNFVATLKACRGRYVALLEGDDYWTDPHKLQKQVEFLEAHPECSMCFHAVSDVYEREDREPHRRYPPDQRRIYTLEDIVVSCIIPTCSLVFKNKLFTDFPDWYYRLPMGDWSLQILNAQYGHAAYLGQNMAAYRTHPGGVWTGASKLNRIQGDIQLYKVLLSFPALLPREPEAKERTLGKIHWMLALCSDELGRSSDAKVHFEDAVFRYNLIDSASEFAVMHLLYSSSGLRSPEQIYRLVGALPSDSATARKFIRRTWAQYHTVLFYMDSADKKPRQALQRWAKAVWYNPASLKNVGMWSVAIDSLLGHNLAGKLRVRFRGIGKSLILSGMRKLVASGIGKNRCCIKTEQQ